MRSKLVAVVAIALLLGSLVAGGCKKSGGKGGGGYLPAPTHTSAPLS